MGREEYFKIGGHGGGPDKLGKMAAELDKLWENEGNHLVIKYEVDDKADVVAQKKAQEPKAPAIKTICIKLSINRKKVEFKWP